ncbi:uncharacterized protein N7483_012745 [Penicillium malachiteum]|uniref:uncharacterized protein n=1 Tax=Penicillium malachiteum TaxID=1324776 RepID=UPI0025488E5F|nr:uncharacterized protein N7483_012745 [Penicillium malachiteum]KAJ5715564.1 hypothetical protein N7483_012745 [Penicillium malachiteum]
MGIAWRSSEELQKLEVSSGLYEDVNDKNIPLHWPLKKLGLGCSCGDLIQNPFKGLFSRLELYLTGHLRFEGPKNEEHIRLYDEANPKGTIQIQEDIPFRIDPNRKLDPENEPPAGPINLKKLGIYESDAIATFCRMFGALPHIIHNLPTLKLQSTRVAELGCISEDRFCQFFTLMENLQVLNFTVGEAFEDDEVLLTLYKILPTNLTTLYFRGPVWLATSEYWTDWLNAFRSLSFLPKLQRLAFVLDLHYGEPDPKFPVTENHEWYSEECPAPTGLLRQVRQECETLYEIARDRGIILEDMPAEPLCDIARCVDPRW